MREDDYCTKPVWSAFTITTTVTASGSQSGVMPNNKKTHARAICVCALARLRQRVCEMDSYNLCGAIDLAPIGYYYRKRRIVCGDDDKRAYAIKRR